MSTILDDDLITSAAAADLLGIPEPELRKLRATNKGPIYLKVGKSVRYYRQHVWDYIDKSLPKSSLAKQIENRISELETRLEKLENKLRRDLDDEALSISRLISKNASNI